MDETTDQEAAIDLFQQLGLKAYEAKSFVALTRRQSGTAKEISDTSEVPRTRVYDAIRVLESMGLVEIQHSNPKRYRAVPIDEAVDTLRGQYETRVESLQEALQGIEPILDEAEQEVTHEVWTLAGEQAITNRTGQLIDGAEDEVVFVVGHRNVFSDALAERLRAAIDRGITVIIGTTSEDLRTTIEDAVPAAEVFVSGLEWLRSSDMVDDGVEISRLILVDRETILVSSFHPVGDERSHEQAVFGRGFENGLVVIIRRLMSTGLLPGDDPRTAGK